MKSAPGKAPERPRASRSAESSSSASSEKSRPTPAKSPAQPRPPLQQQKRSKSPGGASSSGATRSHSHGKLQDIPQGDGTAASGEATIPTPLSSSSELERLKAAVNTAQSRHTLKQWSPSTETGPSATSPADKAPVPNIVSSSMVVAEDSPGSGLRAGSTYSNDSANTVRAFPSRSQVQTPSYPFPRTQESPGRRRSAIRRTSQVSQGSFSEYGEGDVTPGRITSPLVRTAPRFEPGVENRPGDSPRTGADDPTPSLYDVVLRINSESSSLESWWSLLIDIMCDWYRVDRMSLALPIDSTDIHNLPWGQKACYNADGLRERPEERQKSPSNAKRPHNRTVSFAKKPPLPTQPVEDQGKRPQLQSRHSFAGYEVGGGEKKKDSAKSPPLKRPSISRRKTDRAEKERPDALLEEANDMQTPPGKGEGLAFRGGLASPLFPGNTTTAVHSELVSLDREDNPMADSSTISLLLERRKTIVMTRKYTERSLMDQYRTGPRPATHAKNLQSGQMAEKDADKPFEEFEQVPPSPWAESPAPSPAIQADPADNPFFAAGNLNEDSFAPSPIMEQQGHYGQHSLGTQNIRAIGVENSNSVLHIPLYLPGPFTGLSPPATGPSVQSPTQEGGTIKKEPVAILSLSSAHVPYPESLLNSLRLLAPHLATSFSNAYQNSLLQERFQGAFQLRGGTSRSLASALGKGQGLGIGLENLLSHDLEETSSSTTASLVSPSEYSSRSRHSPGSSAVQTPAVENLDSYFDSRKISESSGAAVSSPGTKQQMGPAGKRSDSLKPGDAAARRHSLLHSFGADLNASFNTLPTSAVPKAQRALTLASGASLGTPSGDPFLPPSERLLRLMIDSLPVQIFTAAPSNGEITWVNSKLLVYRGCTAAEIRHDAWGSIHEDDVDTCVDSWRHTLITGSQFQQKARVKRFDGVYRWFYIRAVPLKDKQQNIVHWIGTAIDIDDQHAAETQAAKQQETAASEARWKTVANSSPQIVFAATRKRGITFCNLRWLEYSGQAEHEAMGAGFLDCVYPEDIVKCKLPVFDESGTGNVPVSMPAESRRKTSSDSTDDFFGKDAATVMSSPTTRLPQRKLSELASTGILRLSKNADGKPSYSTEVRLRMKSGEYRWHLVRVVPQEFDPSEPSSDTWYGTATDINDHKELEETLKETMDAKSRFLSNMSHEIRTPLNGIAGMASLLMDSNLTPEQLDQVSVIRASTEGLRDLINDILDLSKVEAGMITLNMDWFHIRSVIEDVNDLTAPMAVDKGLELNYVVEDHVPITVDGDKFRFRQVLLNVIGNAIKFTQTGEIFVHCQVVSDEYQESPIEVDSVMIKVDISDTGPGFTEKEAERLFKRFSQIDGSSTREHGGSGLGLVISHELVELHGGTMSASSKPGRGSIFTFTMKFGVSNLVNSPKDFVPEKDLPAAPILEGGDVQSPGGTLPSPPAIESLGTPTGPANLPSPLGLSAFYILVVCPLPWTRRSTVHHVERVLTKDIPFQIATCETVAECQQLLQSKSRNSLTHLVLIVQEADPLVELINRVASHETHGPTIVLISDVTQQRAVTEQVARELLDELVNQGRLQIVLKPLKPSKLGPVFDPEKSRSHSHDKTKEVAQRLALRQKQMFDDMSERLGNKGHRVLLVEDNKINQMVMLKLLQRISVAVETALDGAECTDLVFSKAPDYYSIILCDLQMPKKDGYQTCMDIRKWERERGLSALPIIALSANVLGDVQQRCLEAGFDTYLTKPIEFQQLYDTLGGFLDRRGFLDTSTSRAVPSHSGQRPSKS